MAYGVHAMVKKGDDLLVLRDASGFPAWSGWRRNFLYIAASDLVPEVNRHFGPVKDAAHFLAFVAGILILYLLRSGL